MINELKNIDVINLIPQKDPFVMVSDLVDFSPTKITTNFTVSKDNLFVENNHLTEPGVIEHMAQSVALHTGCEFFLKQEQPPTGYIGSIKRVIVNKLPKVNTTLKTEVTILHEFMGITLVDITVFCNDQEIANGEMKTVIAKN